MSSQYAKQLLSKIQTQQAMGKRNQLPVGQHRLAIIAFARRTSKKNPHSTEGRYQADFEVVSSDKLTPGFRCSTAFFVERSNFPEYEFDRARCFIEAVGQCVGDTRGTAVLGEDMLDPAQNYARGVVIDVRVVEDLGADGKPKMGKSGAYTTETWTPIEQTAEQVQEARDELDKTYPPELPQEQAPVQPPAAKAAAPAQTGAAWAGQTATPATPPAGGSLLRKR